ncbi:MAG: DNA-binding protein [Planctomycetes bacterium]|nr:DNA-binding protein [Planctomycetota bacterium]
MRGSFVVLVLAACSSAPPPPRVHAFRLLPGQDLRAGIQRFVDEHGIEAGWIATCVGSLTEWSLRFANEPDGRRGAGHFEIVSLCGTVSRHGSHLHLAVADGEGRTIGGHVLEGCRVYTTAELVIGESPAHVFTRAQDGSTPWAELQIGWRR